jgi:hypothetical protein
MAEGCGSCLSHSRWLEGAGYWIHLQIKPSNLASALVGQGGLVGVECGQSWFWQPGWGPQGWHAHSRLSGCPSAAALRLVLGHAHPDRGTGGGGSALVQAWLPATRTPGHRQDQRKNQRHHPAPFRE